MKFDHAFSLDLIQRSTYVQLNENSILVNLLRESPLNLIRLDRIKCLVMAGEFIGPSIPAWHLNLLSFEDLFDFILLRLFDPYAPSLNIIKIREGPHK
tara:strand:+ start:588 stop:881 length:294 start_codon:yes stop_codon:yes gene_type:complete